MITNESEEGTCENYVIDEGDCADVYLAIVSGCIVSDGRYYGGELSQGCLDYIL